MLQLYDKELIQTFPPFDLSDHSMVLLEPKSRCMRNTSSLRSFTQRDTHPSCKCKLSRYLGSLDWSALVFAPNCQSKLQLFCDLVKISLDTIIPLQILQDHQITREQCSLGDSWVQGSYQVAAKGVHANQFGSIPESSTLQALISMVCTWAQAWMGLDKRWESCFWIRKRLIWWIIRYWPTRSSHYA